MDKNREEISKLLVILFTSLGVEITEQIKDMLEMWIAELVTHNQLEIENNIKHLMRTFKPEYGRKYPCLAEILGTTDKDNQLQLQGEIDNKWAYFKRNMCNNLSYGVVPEDVALWKRMLGAERCENMTENSEPWLKKEFAEVYQNSKDKAMLYIEPKVSPSEFRALLAQTRKDLE